MQKGFVGLDGFIWWQGVVEDRKDPIMLGRVRVRIFGFHTEDTTAMPTENLPWALVCMPIDHGTNPVGLREGDWVVGFFKDGVAQQEPVVMFVVPGIPTQSAVPGVGFSDPTTIEQIQSGEVPRPPEFSEPTTGDQQTTEQSPAVTSAFANPNKLPIQGTAVGVLSSAYSPATFPYDLNNDGVFDEKDAQSLIEISRKNLSFNFQSNEQAQAAINAITYPASRYPLEPFLNEPTTPRLARNSKIEETIIAKKNGTVSTFPVASYAPISGLKLSTPTILKSTKGTSIDQLPLEGEPFEEPASAYAAKYPYNHVYASESGHFVEIDDTPKAERLHWYHRSGTFREVHPDGVLVDKSVKDSYHISIGNIFKGSKNLNLSSTEATKIKSGSEFILESKASTITTGEFSIKSGTTLQDMEGGHGQRISDNKEVTVGGDYIIKTGGKFSLEANSIELKATSHIAIDVLGSHVSIRTLGGVIVLEAQSIGNNCGSFGVTGAANLVPTFSPQYTSNPEPSLPTEEDKKEEDPTPAPFRPGFVLKFSGSQASDPYGTSYLYKPDSDSDGKPVVLCPPGNGSIIVYEALPTGELEEVDIEYRYAMGQITKWTVKRPRHRRGNIIERPRFAGNANGGRDHYRFSKYAKDYPQQFIVADGKVEFLILDGKIRHD